MILNRTKPGDLIPLEKVEELFGHSLAGTVPDDYEALHYSAQRGLGGVTPRSRAAAPGVSRDAADEGRRGAGAGRGQLNHRVGGWLDYCGLGLTPKGSVWPAWTL